MQFPQALEFEGFGLPGSSVDIQLLYEPGPALHGARRVLMVLSSGYVMYILEGSWGVRKLSVVDSTKILSWLHRFYRSLSVKGLPEGQILYRLGLTP